jgi:hypothetical protein
VTVTTGGLTRAFAVTVTVESIWPWRCPGPRGFCAVPALPWPRFNPRALLTGQPLMVLTFSFDFDFDLGFDFFLTLTLTLLWWLVVEENFHSLKRSAGE